MLQKVKTIFEKNDVAFLFASTLIVNAGNYAINLLLGRFLGPAQFSEAGVLATLVLVLSFLAVGLQLATAKFSATYFGQNDTAQLNAFQNWIFTKSRYLSFAIAGTLLLLVLPITRFLNFESALPLALVFVGIPLYFHFSVSRGLLQGTNRFLGLASTYQSEMWGRLAFTFVLLFFVLKNQLPFSSEAVSLGFLASFLFTFLVGKYFLSSDKSKKIANKTPFLAQKTVYRFATVIGFYEFSQILINNSDVLLVKHYFADEEAGLYAAIALIGRVVFFATWTIVTLLFPKVIQREQQGLPHRLLFWQSLGFVFTIGAGITAACFYFDEWILRLLFGEAYLAAAPYLWQYATATTLFACANVFAYYFMSLNQYLPVYLSVAVGVAQIVGITFFHQSLLQIIQLQIALMGALFVGMCGCYAWYGRR